MSDTLRNVAEYSDDMIAEASLRGGYNFMKPKLANKAMNDLFNAVNICGGEQEITNSILDAVSHEHRTLKQSFMRAIIIPIINHFANAYEQGTYDARNEATCKLCYELKKVTDKHPLPFI
jgi:hypothetical protein